MRQRLAAVLAADGEGYSKRMTLDEPGTVVALDAARAIFRRHTEANEGRIVDTAGDSVLAVFDSVLGAMNAAIAVQRELNADAAKHLPFRIGIHIGDIIEKADGTVYGHGVNIAARVQASGKAGWITVSEAVRNAVQNRLAARFIDQGEHHAKNIAEAIRVFRLEPMHCAAAPAQRTPEKPSIAVLPFKVLTDDIRIEFLVDGIAEDVVALLARVAGFFVISPASSFTFRKSNLPLKQIAQQLTVQYVVEGSVRVAGETLRINTQLTEGDTGRLLWSGQFERIRRDAEHLQDDIARGIMTKLEPELTRAEIAVIRRQRPENITAWGHYQQALGEISLRGWNQPAVMAALEHLERALAIDPDFSMALASQALWTVLAFNTGLLARSDELEKGVLRVAEKAIALDDGASQVLGYAGCAIADLGDHGRGMEILERALELDPTNAQACVAIGATLALAGDSETGIERMRHGMRMSPRDRRLGFWSWALSHFLFRAGRTEESLQEARMAARYDPRLHLPRIVEAAALAKLSRMEEAQQALAAARRIRPELTIEEIERSHGRRIARELGLLWASS